MTNKVIGKYGEGLAKDFLTKKGFKILDVNFRYSKLAEIDIIALKNNVLHFVEVKTRTQEFFGSPLEAVDVNKLKSIYNCARYYISQSKEKYCSMQIDVIGIVIDKKTNEILKLDFVENISL